VIKSNKSIIIDFNAQVENDGTRYEEVMGTLVRATEIMKEDIY
jgi:hypothetical protein